MSDQDHKEKPEQHDEEVFKTFDMYTLFSRKDVLLALAFIVVLLIAVLFYFLSPQSV